MLRHRDQALKVAGTEDTGGMPGDERYIAEAVNNKSIEALREEIQIQRCLGSHGGILRVGRTILDSIEIVQA